MTRILTRYFDVKALNIWDINQDGKTFDNCHFLNVLAFLEIKVNSCFGGVRISIRDSLVGQEMFTVTEILVKIFQKSVFL